MARRLLFIQFQKLKNKENYFNDRKRNSNNQQTRLVRKQIA